MRRLIVAGVLAIVLAAFAARLLISQRIQAQQAENESLTRAIEALGKVAALGDALHELIADLLARKQIIENLETRSSPAAEALADLSRLPDTIVLARVQIEGLRLEATGVARGDGAAEDMIDRLGKMRFIRNPRVARLDAPLAHPGFGPGSRAFVAEMDLRR